MKQCNGFLQRNSNYDDTSGPNYPSPVLGASQNKLTYSGSWTNDLVAMGLTSYGCVSMNLLVHKAARSVICSTAWSYKKIYIMSLPEFYRSAQGKPSLSHDLVHKPLLINIERSMLPPGERYHWGKEDGEGEGMEESCFEISSDDEE